jgi:hypothetical protein
MNMDANTTRRSLLRLGTGALAYSAGAAILVDTAKAAGPALDRRAWDRALAAYRAAVTASDEHYRLVEEPAIEEAERRAPFAGCYFEDTAKSGQTVRHRWDPKDPNGYEGLPPGSVLTIKAREVRRAWEAHQQARQALGMDAIAEQSNALYTAITPAEDALFETPAPDLAGVAVKLDLLWNDDRDQIPSYQELVRADVRRLSSGEA